jgi:hypothetical protein
MAEMANPTAQCLGSHITCPDFGFSAVMESATIFFPENV